MKFPDRFLRYFLIATSMLLLGIVVVTVQTAVMNPDPEPLTATELRARADYHRLTVMPFMSGVYPRLLFLNAGVALVVLVVPLFWVWVWWFHRDRAGTMITFMQGTVCLLMLALGHNSFTKIYGTYKLLPGQIVAAIYLPHGVPEMLAFILAGTFALLTIRALRDYLQKNGDSPALHIGDICLFILGRVWKIGLVLFVLMAGAAAIECWVTPKLVETAFGTALP
ncbi:MAG TPA: hypothetical protein VLL74_03075 [Methanoregula sp.]|nr:hypothetical protein [Methanoregula sp.]